MKRLFLPMIVENLHGEIVRGTDHLIIQDIVTGTRRIKQGALLFDLRRGKVDVPAIGRKKYVYAIITDKPEDFAGFDGGVTMIRVADMADAYWRFIDFYRDLFHIPVIGVTGTCGKTTTKEMIKHILTGNYKVNATYKSYNALFHNLGYLLDIDEDTQAAVYEMGIAFPGDLKTSCRYFKPQVGVITNIGIDHLQGFGSLEAYIQGKAEFLEGMGFRGTLILNADDENIKKIDLGKFGGNVITFGYGDSAHFKASNIRRKMGVLQFDLWHQDKNYQFSLPSHGEFDVTNAIAAITASHAIGVDVKEAGDRLASFKNVEKHFQFKAGINGSTIIDDTWSTNPTSIEAALKMLKSLSQGKKTIAVLGRMSLLGRQSGKYHWETGEKVAEIGINRLIVIGEGAAGIGQGALKKGMDPGNVYLCKDSDEAYEVLERSLDKNTIALVKTSMMASYKDLMDKIIVKSPTADGQRNEEAP